MHRHVGVGVFKDLRGVDEAAVGQVDSDGLRGGVVDDVPIGEHVELFA